MDISYGKNKKSGELKIEVYYNYGSENKNFYYFFDESKNNKMEEEKMKLDFNHRTQIKKNQDKNMSKKKDNIIWLLIIFLTLSITIAIIYNGESKKKLDLIQNLKPISIIYNINEYSPEVYEITSPMSKDTINIANLIPNQLTKNMAQRIKKITKGQIKKLDNGYEIFNTSGDWPDKYFIINSQVSIEYNIKDGKLKNVYEHLKINKGKKLKDYIF